MPRGVFKRKPFSEEHRRNIGNSQKGRIPWNKGLKKDDPRVMKYTITKIGKKRPELSNEKNPAWKGDAVGYKNLHNWVRKKLGKPNFCEFCKSTKKKIYHWSNISEKYKRDVTDWQRLCVWCHNKYDWDRRKAFIIKCVGCEKKVKTKTKHQRYCTIICWKKNKK